MTSAQRRAGVAAAAVATIVMVCEKPLQASRNIPTGQLPPLSEQPFLDVAIAAGLELGHAVGDGYMDNIIESLRSGAVWLYADGDKDLDVYPVTQSWLEGVSSVPRRNVKSSNKLYLNARILDSAPADNYVLWSLPGQNDIWIATGRGLSHGRAADDGSVTQ